MANNSNVEDRHQQSVRSLLAEADLNGWDWHLIENDGIRQYRLTKDEVVLSAYFWQEDELASWKFVCGFRHGEMEPLRLTAVRALLEQT
jgi:hypothetical protein